MKLFRLIPYLFLMFIASSLDAQHFEGGLQGGLNLCQVDGDMNAGYNKLGFNGGVFVNYLLEDNKNALGFDLMYMGKGSRNRRDPEGLDPVWIYSYHYLEIPVYYRFIQEKYSLRSGLAWAYVFNSKFDDGGSNKEISGLKNTDILFHLGAEYKFGNGLGALLSYEYSVTSIIDLNKANMNVFGAQFRRNGVYHNLIQLSLTYNLTK